MLMDVAGVVGDPTRGGDKNAVTTRDNTITQQVSISNGKFYVWGSISRMGAIIQTRLSQPDIQSPHSL